MQVLEALDVASGCLNKAKQCNSAVVVCTCACLSCCHVGASSLTTSQTDMLVLDTDAAHPTGMGDELWILHTCFAGQDAIHILLL